ncbi:enoyl-CoA hydratase/isomerase family protein [Thermodesulfobacteriota bacterium]
MNGPIKLKKKDAIAEIWLNRPEAFNSFDLEMVGQLTEVLLGLSLDSKIEGVIISGAGKAFCAGGDLKWINKSGKNYGSSFHQLAAKYHQSIVEIRRMPKPVVAAINGLAAGGGFSLSLACDFRIMEKSAVLKQAYTSNGLSIDGGGTFILPRIVGLARALEIAAFDRPIDSSEALRLGLVTDVVEDGESLKRAASMIEELQKGSLASFTASKNLLTDSFDTTFEAQLENERDMLSRCASGPEGVEGIRAFIEKRSADYKSSR